MIIDTRKGSRLATVAAIAVAAALPMGGAHAYIYYTDADLDALRAKFAECKRVPDSLRDMCVTQAQADFNTQLALAQPPRPSTEVALLNQAEARYRGQYAACSRLIDSERDICRAQAQAERSQAIKDALDHG